MTAFRSGRIVGTHGAIEAMRLAGVSSATLLERHLNGDWGDLDEDDKRANNWSLHNRARLLSSYRIAEGVTVWIITEADRSSTTFLLPSEY